MSLAPRSWPGQVHAQKAEAESLVQQLAAGKMSKHPTERSLRAWLDLSNNIVKLQHTCLQVHVCMLNMRLQMPGYNTRGLCTQKNRGSKAKKTQTPQRLAAGFGQDMN
jgi:hypothetical protein